MWCSDSLHLQASSKKKIFSRIFSPDFFSSFLWEKVPRKILQENPRQNPPKLIQQKSPTHFCRGSGPTERAIQLHKFGDGPNTVSESTVSNTELSEFFGPHRVPGGENSVSSSQPIICVPKRTHRVFRRTRRVTEFAVKLSEAQFRSGQSTVGGPKWTKIDPFRPKWAKMDHFGPFWSREYQNPVRNKVILTKMVVLTILDL